MNQTHDIYAITLIFLFALAAGLVGCFALMKRMLIASDVVSHLTLPGLGLAYVFHFNPLLGAACSLLVGIILIAQLQWSTGLTTDTMIAVVFAVSLAVGAALTPREDLADAFFGNFQPIPLSTFLLALLAICLVIVFIVRLKDQLILSFFSPELAAASGVPLHRVNFGFLLIFGITVLMGIRFMGALLSGSLIMLPAAIGRRLTNSLKGFLWISSFSSIAIVGIGTLISGHIVRSLSLGPAATLVGTAFFGVSLLCKRA